MTAEIKRIVLWEIIAGSRKNAVGGNPDAEMVVKSVCNKMKVRECTDIVETVKSEIKSYRDFMKKQKSKGPSQRKSLPGDYNFVVLKREDYQSYEDIDIVMEEEKTGATDGQRCYKHFIELSDFRKRCRTDPLVATLKQFIADENLIKKEGSPLTVNQLLGYLLHRLNYMENKGLARVGAQIFKEEFTPQVVDASDAITLKHDLTLSKEDMRVVKRYFNEKGVSFPNTNELLAERQKLRPKIQPVLELDEKGVSVDYEELVRMTTAAVFDAANYSQSKPLESSLLYKIIYKDGADGSGCQTIWKSKSMKEAVPNMFQHSIVPLALECCLENGEIKVVWENPAPNNATWCRPAFLVRMVEGEAAKHVVPYTDRCRARLKEETITVTAKRSGLSYQVQHDIRDTMKDLKYKKTISGLQGADCILCKYRKADLMDEEMIVQGFDITRTAEETLQLFMKLIDADGNIPRERKDYNKREGLTQQPLTTSDQHSICITHSYINITEWFVKVLARLNAAWLHWVEKSTVYGDHIRAGTDRVKEIIKDGLDLRVAQVGDANAKTGGSTDGNTGREFFKGRSLPTILSCVDNRFKGDVAILHKNLSCLLRIISSSDHVDLVKFKSLLVETSLHIARKFPWVEINYTLHGVLHHSYELVIQNDGYSLGALSEEALESTNKFIRRYAELFSRKTSPLDQLTDVMARLLEKSDPYIVERRMNFRPRKRRCAECGSNGHTTKRHEQYKIDSYDEIVNLILV